MKTFEFECTAKRFQKGEGLLRENGDWDGLNFHVRGVEGQASYKDGIAKIIIKDKPFLVSWDMIEEICKNFFA